MQKIRPDMDIGKNIQTIRYANKLTQDQVIAKLNLMGISMSKSTYAKLETNRMNIKVSNLLPLLKSSTPISTHSFPGFSKPEKQPLLKFLLLYRSFLFSPFFSNQSNRSILVYFLSHFYNRLYS